MKLNTSKNSINSLIFSGGGIKGLCFLGSLRALEEYNIIENIDFLVGSSAGAITSYLINIGYDSIDLMDIIEKIDLEFLKDITSDCILNYFSKFGIDTGNKIMKIIEIFSSKKEISKDITFEELFEKTKKTLVITGTNLNSRECVFFSKDTHRKMKVLDAIRISICIPYIFTILVILILK